MTFEEWVKEYEKHTGDTHGIPDGYTTLYDKDKGYAQYKVEDNRLCIYEVCGDGMYWYNLGVKMCQDHNIPAIVTICTRKIRPYMRCMKLNPIKVEVQEERNNALKIEGVNHLGLRFFAWAAWWDEEKNRHAYYIVTETVKDGEKNED